MKRSLSSPANRRDKVLAAAMFISLILIPRVHPANAIFQGAPPGKATQQHSQHQHQPHLSNPLTYNQRPGLGHHPERHHDYPAAKPRHYGTDQIFSGEERVVPTGPNPLHN